MIQKIGTISLVFLVSGCMSSPGIKPVNPEYVDLTYFVNSYFERCLPNKTIEFCGDSETVSCPDAETICSNRAERAAKTARKYFHLYREDKMKNKCGTDIQCLHEYQRNYYDSSLKSVLDKSYPSN